MSQNEWLKIALFIMLYNLTQICFLYQDCVENYIKCVPKRVFYHISQYHCTGRSKLHLRQYLLNLTLTTEKLPWCYFALLQRSNKREKYLWSVSSFISSCMQGNWDLNRTPTRSLKQECSNPPIIFQLLSSLPLGHNLCWVKDAPKTLHHPWTYRSCLYRIIGSVFHCQEIKIHTQGYN